jgi:hypothetical protein
MRKDEAIGRKDEAIGSESRNHGRRSFHVAWPVDRRCQEAHAQNSHGWPRRDRAMETSAPRE